MNEKFDSSAPSAAGGIETEPTAGSALLGAQAVSAAQTRLLLVGQTDVGLLREHNEDNFLLVRLDDGSRDPQALEEHSIGLRGTLLVVCDGMGGAAAGEIASGMAVESMAETMLSTVEIPAPEGMVDDAKTALGRKLRCAAQEANLRIFREARENLARSGMGTTMTAVTVRDGHAIIAQVGDSRAYLWRQGALTQITRDQSLVNQLLETGQITPEQAKSFEHSNVILQALGVQEEVEVQLSQVALRRDDRLLLCSDGLVGVVTDEEIGAVLGAGDSPRDVARILIEMANAGGGPDNITVVVAFVAGEGVPSPTEGEVVEYRPWRIDPEPPSDAVMPPALDPVLPVSATDQASIDSTDPEAAISRSTPRAKELLSMAVVLGLLLGGLLTGLVLYRRSVPCDIRAQPGFRLLTDGRDSGARTVQGVTSLRLSLGHHRVSLAGDGAPDESYEVDVSRDRACTLNFVAAPTSSPPVVTP